MFAHHLRPVEWVNWPRAPRGVGLVGQGDTWVPAWGRQFAWQLRARLQSLYRGVSGAPRLWPDGAFSMDILGPPDGQEQAVSTRSPPAEPRRSIYLVELLRSMPPDAAPCSCAGLIGKTGPSNLGRTLDHQIAADLVVIHDQTIDVDGGWSRSSSSQGSGSPLTGRGGRVGAHDLHVAAADVHDAADPGHCSRQSRPGRRHGVWPPLDAVLDRVGQVRDDGLAFA